MEVPSGFLLGGVKRDVGVGLLFSETRCSVAGVFTRNTLRAAPVEYSEEVCSRGHARGVIVNSGHANALTGEEGMQDVLRMADGASRLFGVPDDEVLVCSTGVIGERPPVDRILKLAEEVWESRMGSDPEHVRAFNEAIMTTDTREKVSSYSGGDWCLLGVAKGAGMIHPRMSTMLAFLITDVRAAPHDLQPVLRDAVEDTFNMISVDADESTNDTVLLMANGASGLEVGRDVPESEFEEAVRKVCEDLAREIARDGEGSTKFLEVEVRGARSRKEARRAARAVVSSNLVKAALFGEDPNWGRVGAAIGAARVDVDPSSLKIIFESSEGRVVTYDGGPVKFDEEEAARVLSDREVRVVVDLGVGDESARAWGCDLTYDYVKINAEYRT